MGKRGPKMRSGGMTKVSFNIPLDQYSRLMQRAEHSRLFVSAYCRAAVVERMDADTAPSLVPEKETVL